MGDVDVFVGNNTIIEPEVYRMWLNGYTAHDTSHMLQRRGVLQQYGANFDMLLSDTLDHYRTYTMLEPLVKNPPKMTEQLKFQITPQTHRMLIEKYYQFDSCVIREILGKKLTSRYRNSLVDISDKTKVPLRSCRRQFDNVKRVFKTVEDLLGSLVDNIIKHFLLPRVLARQYAAIVFIANNRFECGKRKLYYLTFEDFAHCANEMITHWSYSSKDCQGHEDMDVDIDRNFLMGLRELKALTEKEHVDAHKILVCKGLQGKISRAASLDLENNFKNYSKNLINIAYGLNHSKELKDFFIDLVEKIVEPCKSGGWTPASLQEFLAVYKDSSPKLDFFARQHPQSLKVWFRYLTTVTSCILKMYHT